MTLSHPPAFVLPSHVDDEYKNQSRTASVGSSAAMSLPEHLTNLVTSVVVPRWLIQPTTDLLRPYAQLLMHAQTSSAAPRPPRSTPSGPAGTRPSSSSSTVGHTISLWSVIAPFDHHCQFACTHIWPQLSDLDAIRAMCVNKATQRHFNRLVISETFTLLHENSTLQLSAASHCPNGHRLHPTYPFSNRYCQPNPRRLEGGLLKQLWPLLPRLSHLIHLDITMTGSADIGDELRLLPATVTCFHLTIPSLLCKRLKPGALPSSLRTLTVYRGYNESSAFPQRVLPAQLEELRIEDTAWDYSLNSVFVPGSELRVFDVQGMYSKELTTLPTTLTELDLSGSRWNHDLASLNFPQLKTLKLGGSGPLGYERPITAKSLAGLPALATLDLLSVMQYPHLIEPDVLSCLPSLTHLSLPALYSHPLTPGVLPQSLLHLVIGSSDIKLKVGCLPHGLLTLRMASSIARARFNRPLPAGVIPSTLTELFIDSDDFNRPLHATFPVDSQITMFSMFSPHFAQPLPSFAHLSRLRTLALCISWPSPLPPNSLPATLTTINIGGGYVHTLTPDTVAYIRSLDTLDLDSSTPQGFSEQLFHAVVGAGVLPVGLKRLHLPYDYPHNLDTLVVPAGCVVSVGRCDIWSG